MHAWGLGGARAIQPQKADVSDGSHQAVAVALRVAVEAVEAARSQLADPYATASGSHTRAAIHPASFATCQSWLLLPDSPA